MRRCSALRPSPRLSRGGQGRRVSTSCSATGCVIETMRVVKAGTVEEAMRVVMVSFKMNKTPNSRSHLVNSGKRLNNPSVCERPLLRDRLFQFPTFVPTVRWESHQKCPRSHKKRLHVGQHREGQNLGLLQVACSFCFFD